MGYDVDRQWTLQIITIVHQIGPDHTVDHVRKRLRLTSTKGMRGHEVFGATAT